VHNRCIIIIIIIIVITTTIFMVLSSWPKSLREFTRFIWWMQTERRVAANPQIKPVDLGWVHRNENLQLPSTSTIAIIIITQPTSWYSFTVPQRMEGRVDLGIAVKVRSPCPRLYTAAAVAINTTACSGFEPGSSHTAVGRANHSATETYIIQYCNVLNKLQSSRLFPPLCGLGNIVSRTCETVFSNN